MENIIPAQNVAIAESAVIKEQWLPQPALVTSQPGARSKLGYSAVIWQFLVHRSIRYRPTPKSTFCKTFAEDVTAAMGCPVPHWVDDVGNPVPVGKGHEMRANALQAWLSGQVGREHGWKTITVPGADREAAERGEPTMAVWTNKDRPDATGHVAMIVPGPAGNQTIWVAQAGLINSPCLAITGAFSAEKLRDVTYWTHA